MNINKLQENGTLTFALEGKLDTKTAPQLQEMLLPAIEESKKVVLDFTNLSYVASAGLRVLLMGQKQAKAKGITMTITGVSPQIMEIFELIGFANVLNIELLK